VCLSEKAHLRQKNFRANGIFLFHDPPMEWLANSGLIWMEGRFLGIEWHVWKVVGWVGNAIFFSRFLVQWYATERQRRVVVPQAFWWLSLVGSLILLSYAIQRRDSVFIAGQAFSWVPYLRNLWIHRKTRSSQRACPACHRVNPADYRHCPDCGAPVQAPAAQGSVLAEGR
jgi:lipid-A-disaccharide synthase-like uncharacterized protein